MGYVGKDFIHYGCGLELNPDKVWECVPSSVRKNIKKAAKSNVKIERVSGTDSELKTMKTIWYFPEDPNFPMHIDKEDVMCLAFLDDEVIAGVILLKVGNHFFLNNLTANKVGKKYCMQDYLLWYLVNELKSDSYIDVGVSYRLNLYRFFNKWATFKYPVIFNPPKSLTHLDFNPVTSYNHVDSLIDVVIDEDKISEYFDNPVYTIVPSYKYALELTKRNIPGALAVDLSKFLPVAEAGVVVGADISPEVLWDEYGCYDHYKTEYIKKLIMYGPARRLVDLFPRIINNYNNLKECFIKEDVDILNLSSTEISGVFYIEVKDASKLAHRYSMFGINTKLNVSETVIGIPCHAYMTKTDIEYIYAVYRGHLNLCSEWESTGVKGELKI